ncbi:MAG: RidA family protein [Verrucomicrobia bacterium]|nr:RidA family protein [Verrucomicrobiota bacterium]
MKSLSFFSITLAAVLFSMCCAVGKIECIEPNQLTGSAKAVVLDAAPLAHTAQVMPLNKKGELVGKWDVSKQAEQVLLNLDAVLKRAKSDLGKVVKLNVYVARAELSDDVSKVLAKQFRGKIKPAVTFVGGDLVHPEVLVTMDAVAVSTFKTKGNAPVHFAAEDAQFSDVTILPSGDAVYLAGMAAKGELASATRETMGKIQDAIAHLGLKRGDIVQLKAFLLPMSQAAVVRDEIGKFFGEEAVPTIVYVDWSSSSVPVEIEAILAAPKSQSEETITYHTPIGTTASPVYSRLARIHSGKRIYISGLYGRSEQEHDVKEIYEQLDQLLEKTGSSRDHMAKATYYYSDPKSNGRLDAFRPAYYNPKTPPTASKVRVKDVGKADRGIVIDMIGVTK